MEKFVIVFAGEYDFACRQQLRTELARIAMLPALILDFGAVTFIDSTCIGEFIRFHKLRAENLFEPETFVVHTPNIRRVFDLLQLDRIFQTANSVGEAMGKGGVAVVKYAFTVDHIDRNEPLGSAASQTQLAG